MSPRDPLPGKPKSPAILRQGGRAMSVPEESVPNCACAAGTTSRRRFAWDLGELLIGYALVLAVIWTPRPLQHWLYWIALGWFIISMILSFESWKALGCCVAGFWRSS